MTKISFSEYASGTTNPIFSFDDNEVITSGVIRSDSSNPTSPVLAGSLNFSGPILIQFENPVAEVNFDAGYFDSIGSTTFMFYGAHGEQVGTVISGRFGIENITFTYGDGISGFLARITDPEPAGFAIDNLTFGDAVATETLAPIFTDTSAGIDRNLGGLKGSDILIDSLGVVDASDSFSFNLSKAATVIWRTTLLSDPTQHNTTSKHYAAGDHVVSFHEGSDYEETEAYSMVYSLTYDQAEANAAEKLINDIVQNWGQHALDTGEAMAGIKAAISSVDDAEKFFGNLAKRLGWVGVAWDLTGRLDAIRASSDPARETWIQTVDLMAGVSATAGGAQIGAGVGLIGLNPATVVVGGILGGLVGGFVYDAALSDAVKQHAAEGWDAAHDSELAPLTLQRNASLIMAVAPGDFIKFDADYYLAHNPGAQIAINSGQFASAYAHYVAIGIKNGALPNADGPLVLPTDLADANPDGPVDIIRRPHVLDVALGAFAGDGINAEEAKVLDLLEGDRTVHLERSMQLTALANRKAWDLVTNGDADPFIKAASGDAAWHGQWSNGETFLQRIDALSDGLSNVTAIVIPTDGASGDDFIKRLHSDIELFKKAIAPNFNAVGIGEFGGVWVLLLANEASPVPPEDEAPFIDQRVGSDIGDLLIAVSHAANFHGGAGDDTFFGGVADDVLAGDGGNDIMDGSAGDADVAMFSGNRSEYDIDFGDAPSANHAAKIVHARGDHTDGTDIVSNIEILRFADGEIDLTADAQPPTYSLRAEVASISEGKVGQKSVNFIVSRDLADAEAVVGLGQFGSADASDASGIPATINFASGEFEKTIIVTIAGDTQVEPDEILGLRIVSVDGPAIYEGAVAQVTIVNDDADDETLIGGNGPDALTGGAGNDLLKSGNGDDALSGGGGDDTLNGGNGDDRLDGGAGNDELQAGNGADLLKGGDGNDTMNGGNGADVLHGGTGKDVLNGGNSADRLEGGESDDTLTGGTGADTFVFKPGFGNDTITSFQIAGASHDFLEFDSGIFADAAALFAHSADSADGVLVTTEAADTLLIKNASLAQLQAHPEDFHFV